MAPGPFFVPIQRVLILAAADACHRYKEKLKLLLSDYQVKAEPWLFEHRGKPIVNEAIGDLRERLAEAVPSLLYRVGSPYHQSALDMIPLLDLLEADLRNEADKFAATLSPTQVEAVPVATAEQSSARADPEVIDELVTLNQVAPLAGLTKRSLERYLSRGQLPAPDCPGGQGKAHKWLWNNIRSPLSQIARRQLPKRFPGHRII